MFTKKLASNIHLRLYNFQETEAQLKQRKEFKGEFTRPIQDKLARTDKDMMFFTDQQQRERESDAPDEEIEIVSNFLEGFIFDTNNKRQD